ncbi:hypothetical protein WQE_47434 [Paraburkholderia hospita]|uniref:Uncharacterized protein n=1 Tax=Paraburkholderia hospita TaxID=169430 RepID=A0ABN0F5H5_9BURK|nr:hypothetical protein WQE_47434 [Paraburkholderia hospita]
MRDACIIDQDIDRAELVQHLLRATFARVDVGDIKFESPEVATGRSAASIRTSAHRPHSPTLSGTAVQADRQTFSASRTLLSLNPVWLRTADANGSCQTFMLVAR